jgi:Zn-dependent protease with chaperone function
LLSSGVRWFVIASCLLLAACQGPVRLQATADEPRLERVRRIGASLAPEGSAIDFGLSAKRGLAAFAWPDGSVLVTRDLADLLDDDELAASLAHEIGHLVDGGHLAPAPAALAGTPTDDDRERRADRTGCRLLATHGRPPAAMPRMLSTLNAALGRDVLSARIAAATDACQP